MVVLGVICLKFRDLEHLTGTAMRMIFFLSPVIWMPEQVAELLGVLKLNPFFHYITLVRAPILDGSLPIESWQIVGAINLVGVCVAIFTYTSLRNRIAYWV